MRKSIIRITILDTDNYFIQGVITLLQQHFSHSATTIKCLPYSKISQAKLIIVSEQLRPLLACHHAFSQQSLVVIQDQAWQRIYHTGNSLPLHRNIAIRSFLHHIDNIFNTIRKNPQKVSPPRVKTLSHRELQILSAIDKGLSQKQTSEKLGLHIKTISAHKRSAMKKLGMQRNHELYNWLRHKGMNKVYQKDDTKRLQNTAFTPFLR